MYFEGLKVKGYVTAQLFDAEGNLKETRAENLVVTVGLGFITNSMSSRSTAVMTHMAVGTDGTAAATGQTALIAQHADGRVALDSTTQVTTTVTNDSIQYVATFAAGHSTGSLVEAGIFNAATAGVMLSRVTFGTITKGVADSLVITWKIAFSAS